MNEFNNRIDAQREILRIVNGVPWRSEALHGLSSKGLERWASRNGLDPAAPIVLLLRTVAAELFFLANRSQEQITETYQAHARTVNELIPRISAEAARHISGVNLRA